MTRAFSRSLLAIAVALTLGTSLVLFASPVQGAEATVIIRPNGQTSAIGWSLADDGCATDAARWDELDEDPHDGDTSCRAADPTGSNTLHVAFENPAPPGTVLDINVYAVVVGRTTAAATIGGFFGTPLCEPESTNPIADLQSATYVSTDGFASKCGSTGTDADTEWTTTNVNDVRLSITCSGASGRCFITQAWVEVRYTIQDEPGPPPPPPLPEFPEQVAQAAAGVGAYVCNLYLLLVLLIVALLAVVVRHMKRTGDSA